MYTYVCIKQTTNYTIFKNSRYLGSPLIMLVIIWLFLSVDIFDMANWNICYDKIIVIALSYLKKLRLSAYGDLANKQ